MLKNEEKLIADVLNVAHLTKLPAAVGPKEFIWIEGVAKIRLLNGTYAYGIIKRNPDLSYRITYINGATSSISEIVEVYPYLTVDKRHVKKFADEEDRDGRIAYLQSLNLPYAEEINFENATVADLNKEIVKSAIYRQLNALEV